MRHDFFDRFSRRDSPVHRLPAALKLLTALALVFGTALLPLSCWTWFAAVTILLLVVVALSRIPPVPLARQWLLLEPLVLGVAVLSLFQPGGSAVFARIFIKGSLCLLTMVLLSGTTPFSELLELLRRWQTPAILITTMALMYRYLFVLIDEAERMHRARRSRTFDRRQATIWQGLGQMLGTLFVRSTERAERIYSAMCARGWK